jgi:hypothetical protein
MGVSGQRHAPAALLPLGKGSPEPIGQEAGWAPEPVWTQRLEEKSFVFAGNRTPYELDIIKDGLMTSVFVSNCWCYQLFNLLNKKSISRAR